MKETYSLLGVRTHKRPSYMKKGVTCAYKDISLYTCILYGCVLSSDFHGYAIYFSGVSDDLGNDRNLHYMKSCQKLCTN